MRRNRVWFIAIIVCVMIITTVCYISFSNNARTEYANGRVVQIDENEMSGAYGVSLDNGECI